MLSFAIKKMAIEMANKKRKVSAVRDELPPTNSSKFGNPKHSTERIVLLLNYVKVQRVARRVALKDEL